MKKRGKCAFGSFYVQIFPQFSGALFMVPPAHGHTCSYSAPTFGIYDRSLIRHKLGSVSGPFFFAGNFLFSGNETKSNLVTLKSLSLIAFTAIKCKHNAAPNPVEWWNTWLPIPGKGGVSTCIHCFGLNGNAPDRNEWSFHASTGGQENRCHYVNQ